MTELESRNQLKKYTKILKPLKMIDDFNAENENRNYFLKIYIYQSKILT